MNEVDPNLPTQPTLVAGTSQKFVPPSPAALVAVLNISEKKGWP